MSGQVMSNYHPLIDLVLLSADFILKLPADQRLTKVTIKYILDVGTKLLNEAVNEKLQEAIWLGLENNLNSISRGISTNWNFIIVTKGFNQVFFAEITQSLRT